jgi:hypothetical protein
LWVQGVNKTVNGLPKLGIRTAIKHSANEDLVIEHKPPVNKWQGKRSAFLSFNDLTAFVTFIQQQIRNKKMRDNTAPHYDS